MADKETEEVPGTILLIPKSSQQQPLGFPEVVDAEPEKKRTADGAFILDPQPDENPNDPLNWAQWRRDAALLCLGWHCLVGGGQTPILAAGFPDVAKDYGVSTADVALTTGLYMLGMGIGCMIASPTAIIYGKRPVYLAGVVLFLGASIWSAASPNYASLVIARIIMGIGVSPCEALPSATIAEIFFLHERAYRIGIYTLLLLGGKNLIPLVSAVIIQSLGWRWVFWIVAIVVGFNLALLFVFVPETFWDRTPKPKNRSRPSLLQRASSSIFNRSRPQSIRSVSRVVKVNETDEKERIAKEEQFSEQVKAKLDEKRVAFRTDSNENEEASAANAGTVPQTPAARSGAATPVVTYTGGQATPARAPNANERNFYDPETTKPDDHTPHTFRSSLRVWNGVLRNESWWKVFMRPVILFAYPAVLWSTVVYSLSVGWLIVLSESVAHVYQHHPYNFTALQTGLVYLSPFVGGIIGTAVAGKASDVVVRFMSRRNGGIYEPEFRLVMALPVAISTALGLMGFGWSVEERNNFWVPTIFFGVISFGCSLGSTTSITFAVDSYRQYAGEALVTLNFSKNVFHGMVFSLFFNSWLERDGSKTVFIALGVIQLGCLAFTIPLYVYGKRLRMWTVRKGMMERW